MELENEGAQALVLRGKISLSNLKQNQYTVSLLNEALRTKFLTQQEVNNIQVQIMLILKELIMQYTKGESSSVTAYTAESLLFSILYCIDAYTLSCSSPEEAIGDLRKIDIKDIYRKGVERVVQWFEETKDLYKEIRKNKLNVQLESYHLTISEAIPLFFKKYNVIFYSHHTMASIDYPLVFDDMSIQGVLYIKRYLEHFKIETEFCKHFSTQDINKMLSNFGKMIRMDYKIELINLFELVFNNAVFSVLSGSTTNELMISKYHFDMLDEKLKSLGSAEISLDIGRAIEKLINTLSINEPDIVDYIHRYKTIFTQRVIHAANNDSLSSIIITEKEEKIKENILLFEDGERMSDNDFKLVVKKLMKLTRTVDKINLIKSSISSLHDFIDILNADCLFSDEFETLFNTLGDMELAILAKMVFYEELRSDFTSLSSVISQEKESETEWKMYYIEFVRKLSEERISLIENCFNKIEYEEINFY